MRGHAPPDAPKPGPQALHRSMFALDIASFSSRRDPAVQKHLRRSVHQIAESSCRAVGLDWDGCHVEDRGDGLYAIAGGEAAIEVLLGPLVAQLLAGVREHNKMANRLARLQLRVAVHAGYVHFDGHGATGLPVTHLFRLLDAPVFKARLAESDCELALIVSDYLHEEVIAFSPGTIDAGTYEPITVQVKETRDRAWIWLPPTRFDLRRPSLAPPPGDRPGLVPSHAGDPEDRLTEMMDLAEELLAARRNHSDGDHEELAFLLFALERLTALLRGELPDEER